MLLHRIVPGTLFSLALATGFAAAEERKEYPAPARERYEQGQQFEKQGRWKQAVEAYEDAIRLGMTDFPRAHLYQARAQLSGKDYAVAIAAYTRFIEKFGIEKSCRY